MNNLIFCVYDAAAKAYLNPFFLPTRAMAERTFRNCANDPDHQFCINAEDYTLFEVGQVDMLDCRFDIHKTPIPVCKAVQVKDKSLDTDNLKLVDRKIPAGTKL